RINAHRAAAEDQAARTTLADLVDRDVVPQDLREDLAFSDAARDQLCVLGAVIDDEDGIESCLVHLAGRIPCPTTWLFGVEQPLAGEVLRAPVRRGLGSSLTVAHRQRHGERAPLAELTLDRGFAAHRARELP